MSYAPKFQCLFLKWLFSLSCFSFFWFNLYMYTSIYTCIWWKITLSSDSRNGVFCTWLQSGPSGIPNKVPTSKKKNAVWKWMCWHFLGFLFLDLIYAFTIFSYHFFMFEVTHLRLSCESCRRLQRPQTACTKVSPNRTTIKCTTVGIRRGHQVPSDHDCKAEDLSLELFRCSAANQRGETWRQDTEGHASEINDDENMAMVNASENVRFWTSCKTLHALHISSHLFTLLVCIACC